MEFFPLFFNSSLKKVISCRLNAYKRFKFNFTTDTVLIQIEFNFPDECFVCMDLYTQLQHRRLTSYNNYSPFENGVELQQ